MADRPKQLACYPDPELVAQIESLAEERGVSVSKVLIESVRKEIQREGLDQ